jgi:hypothetical protein
VIVWCDKEPVPEEDPTEENDPVTGAENVSKDEGKVSLNLLIILLLYVWLLVVEPDQDDYCIITYITHW